MAGSDFLAVKTFAIDDTAFVSSNVAETDYAAWSGATTYALGDRVIVIDTDVHNIYESLQSSNLNNDPQDDPQGDVANPPTWWGLVSATNRWKMFDFVNSSQTVNADTIDVELTIARRPNSLFLGNVECESIQIIMYDGSMVEVYNETYSMIESTGTPSYYSWFTNQIQRKVDLFVNDIPLIAGATFNIILDNTGADAKCGTCIIGYAENLGFTQLGLQVGIRDFSVKRQNDFGDFEVLERAFNKIGEASVFVSNAGIDRLQNTLASYRATPTLYVASTGYACSWIFGFYRDFNIVVQYPNHSLLNIEIEGLT